MAGVGSQGGDGDAQNPDDDPIAAGVAREQEREQHRRAREALEDLERGLLSIARVMARPHLESNAVWTAAQSDLYEATLLVRVEDPRVTRPGDPWAMYSEPAWRVEDDRWEEIRERCPEVPERRVGADALAWAARVAPALVLGGLWIPFARYIRGVGADGFRQRLRADWIVERLRSTLGHQAGVDVQTLAAVAAQITLALVDDPWLDGAPSAAVYDHCLFQLTRLYNQLRPTFRSLGHYGHLLKEAVDRGEPGAEPPPQHLPVQPRSEDAVLQRVEDVATNQRDASPLREHDVLDGAAAALALRNPRWTIARLFRELGARRQRFYEEPFPMLRAALGQREADAAEREEELRERDATKGAGGHDFDAWRELDRE